MHISLPNGDTLIPDEEFSGILNVVRRTLQSLDHQGCPFAMIGGRKYRPRNEALAWINSRLVRRRNPRRVRARGAA